MVHRLYPAFLEDILPFLNANQLCVTKGADMKNDDGCRPYPLDSDNCQPYTRIIPANEVHEWINRQIISYTGSIHNPDHGHLLEADLCFMWASDSFAKKGRYILSQTEQVMLRAVVDRKQEWSSRCMNGLGVFRSSSSRWPPIIVHNVATSSSEHW